MSSEAPDKPRNSQSQNSFALEITEEYIAQVFIEIEGRVTKRPSEDLAGQNLASWVLCPS